MLGRRNENAVNLIPIKCAMVTGARRWEENE